MATLSVEIHVYIPYAFSLKDKRQVRKSLIEKTKNKFNVSIAEVDAQEIHKTLIIGIALVSDDFSHGIESMDKVLRYIDELVEDLGCEMTIIEKY